MRDWIDRITRALAAQRERDYQKARRQTAADLRRMGFSRSFIERALSPSSDQR